MTGTVLTESLLALRELAAEWASGLRAAGAVLDRDPGAIAQFADLPAVRCMAQLLVPGEYGAEGITVAGHRFHGMTALERTVLLEEFARGDAGATLAAPGASMSGVLLDVLGDDEQKAWFYGRLVDRPTWTFFALTEPDAGSDANALTTSLTPGPDGDFVLNGRKRYVGNASRAGMGVVFARAAPGPLGVRAVLVDTASPGFHAEPLDMLGLRGARFCALEFDNVRVPANRVLGRQLSPARRGMWAATLTFNRLRPGVAAIAVGIARAAHEYVRAEGGLRTGGVAAEWDQLGYRIESVRNLVHLAAMEVDAGGSRGGHLASSAKAEASRLAEDVTRAACRFFGPSARWRHPLLDKLVRDARGVEFMEGAANIQKLIVFTGLLAGKVGHGESFPALSAPSGTGGLPCG
ncbi:acyl-CoA dehydrogenase family protein [Amycolatopsis rubida]|uniref:Medium-chain specific acyl-CoA dehydrogenase, mitochondrial n=1 Tax=Amycolatopsis rubida TaxID=112413 RepID=A0A1I5NFI9_9PSEU|nr:acyl-CoA dehydrogenase family protein [Amycolatopsis rubida]SFP20568.1 Acyl-CoA dehydrogenase [Amycolatopsis rubida]